MTCLFHLLYLNFVEYFIVKQFSKRGYKPFLKKIDYTILDKYKMYIF